MVLSLLFKYGLIAVVLLAFYKESDLYVGAISSRFPKVHQGKVLFRFRICLALGRN